MGQERKNRKYSKEFRESALRRWEMAANVTELCQELGISRTLLYWWREMEQREQEKQSQAAEQRLRRENTHLKKALAKTLEVGFFEGFLRKGRGSAPGQYELWRNGIWESGKPSGN